ncbi:hypothetical protein NDU88_004091 [Pleurodeles waltl]|uniref:Uncharacterized protein n=1 Tax=Pleurodeles waltl TaxID=8319 RepID=A0AAV7V3E7_PLEWA|nr:hypothetical protein NDU88_004091 [Pleurodeles waltl]
MFYRDAIVRCGAVLRHAMTSRLITKAIGRLHVTRDTILESWDPINHVLVLWSKDSQRSLAPPVTSGVL